MKTAISIPDPLFEAADRLADRLGKSRSQLYREAVEEYLLRHHPEEVTRAMDRVLEHVDSHPDPFMEESVRRILRRSEW